MPVLVARDRFTKAIWTHLAPCKGTEHFYPEARLVRDIKFLGYAKLILIQEEGPSMLAFANAVKNTFASLNIECQVENSPKGDAHGVSSEMSGGQTQGLSRTFTDHIERNTGKQIDPKTLVLGWLVEHVGVLRALFSHDERAKDD